MQPSTRSQQPMTSNKQRATGSKFLFWLYVLFVVYGVTLPWQPDLTRSGMENRWQHAERIPFLNSEGRRLSFGDAVGNILLFVPFGFFLQNLRQSRPTETADFSSAQRGISPSLLAALAFSSAIECGQLFLDGRVTSVNDVINNVVGAFIGIRLAVAHPGLVANSWEALKRMALLRPFLALWLATLTVQTIIALAPFDFTLKKENLQRQWLRWQYSWQALPSVGGISPSKHNFLHQFPHTEHLLVALFITIGCGVSLGAFWVISCQRYKNHSPHLIRGSTWVTLSFYPILTIAQFTVQSVRPFVLFPVAGLCGVTMGALLLFTFSKITAKSLARHKG
jgi:glycopeptide antibiotics resistance protein